MAEKNFVPSCAAAILEVCAATTMVFPIPLIFAQKICLFSAPWQSSAASMRPKIFLLRDRRSRKIDCVMTTTEKIFYVMSPWREHRGTPTGRMKQTWHGTPHCSAVCQSLEASTGLSSSLIGCRSPSPPSARKGKPIEELSVSSFRMSLVLHFSQPIHLQADGAGANRNVNVSR